MNSVELIDKRNQLKGTVETILTRCREENRDLSEKETEILAEIERDIEAVNTELRTLSESVQINKEINTKIEHNTMVEKRFSLLTAIRNAANNKSQDEFTSSIIERGATQLRDSGLSFTGNIQLPILEERAAITVASEGQDVIATDLMDIVTPIKKKNALVLAGAKVLSGLKGIIQFPKISSGNVGWADENAEAIDGSPTFDKVVMEPKRLTAVVNISKQFLIQDSLDAERVIREQIIEAINNKLQETILGTGAGSANQPKGLFSGNVNTTITDFGKLTDFESGLEDVSNLTYILHPKAKAALRNMTKGAKITSAVYESGEVDGTASVTSTSVGLEKGIALGDFSNLVIGNWGNVDIVVDSISQSHKAMVRLVVNTYFDAAVLNDNAIKVAKLA